MADKRVISMPCDLEMFREIDVMARSQGVPKTTIFRRAILEYLEKQREIKVTESKRRLEELEKKYKEEAISG